jgi:hypothetical protein
VSGSRGAPREPGSSSGPARWRLGVLPTAPAQPRIIEIEYVPTERAQIAL